MPYRQTTLEWLARSDKSARFQTRGLSEGLWLMNQQYPPNDEVSSSGVHDFHLEFEGEEIRQEVSLAQDLARKRNHPKRDRHKEFVRVGCEIMNMCIDSRSTVASSP
jgi:hypothetical protein